MIFCGSDGAARAVASPRGGSQFALLIRSPRRLRLTPHKPEADSLREKNIDIMRFVFYISALAGLLAGCRNVDRTRIEEEPAVGIAAAVPAADDPLGGMITRIYESAGPSEADVRYRLTVENREHSGDGTFRMEITGCKPEDGGCGQSVYSGKRYTLRGTDGDNDATIWQFVAEGGETFNFQYDESEDTLTTLDDKREKRILRRRRE